MPGISGSVSNVALDLELALDNCGGAGIDVAGVSADSVPSRFEEGSTED